VAPKSTSLLLGSSDAAFAANRNISQVKPVSGQKTRTKSHLLILLDATPLTVLLMAIFNFV
jgi:hypothetical protein